MSETFKFLLTTRPWVAHIDDERNLGNSIIVTLSSDWFFADEQDCGVRGFDSIPEVEKGTRKTTVMRRAA